MRCVCDCCFRGREHIRSRGSSDALMLMCCTMRGSVRVSFWVHAVRSFGRCAVTCKRSVGALLCACCTAVPHGGGGCCGRRLVAGGGRSGGRAAWRRGVRPAGGTRARGCVWPGRGGRPPVIGCRRTDVPRAQGSRPRVGAHCVGSVLGQRSEGRCCRAACGEECWCDRTRGCSRGSAESWCSIAGDEVQIHPASSGASVSVSGKAETRTVTW